MSNFLIMSNGTLSHYFYRAYEGICVSNCNNYGIWNERISVFQNANRKMGVYADKSGTVHIICENKQGELVYIVRTENNWKNFVISNLPKEIKIMKMRLYLISGRLNFLASAQYNGEYILIHCILGNHAKPSVVAILEDEHFIISGEKVYFTSSKGSLGYLSLSDEKPQEFTRLYDDAHRVYVKKSNDTEFIIFIRNSKLYINGEEILYDSRMENPIMVSDDNKLCVMWKSGGFIRYTTSFNGGTTWSGAMRFINSGIPVTLFEYQRGNSFENYYGYINEDDITLLGCENLLK